MVCLLGVAALGVSVAGSGCRSDERIRIEETAESLKALTGSRTRIVWSEDHGDNRDVSARGDKRMLRLMGYDSHDGKGARPIIEELSNYSKPLLTPGGERVIFSDFHELVVSIVHFDGTGRRDLTHGIALAVWRDPETGVEWVYVGRDPVDRRGRPYAAVYRFPIDRPDLEERVWDRRPVGVDNFQISADGTMAAGVYPWPDAGVADLRNGTWTRLGNGCWPSLAPDNSYLFWIFDGNHREVRMFDLREDRRWTLSVNTAPETRGYEIYHPRWSNHPRFITVTGPYTNRVGHSFIRGGGPGVEIYVGRFNETFTEIEAWVRVTESDRANFLPDVWIESAAVTPAVDPLPIAVAERPDPVKAWPVTQEDLLFLWEDRSRNNEIDDAISGRVILCRVEPEGRARYGRFHDMDVRRGRFVAEHAERLLKERYRIKPALSLEALITPDGMPGEGEGVVMGLSSGPGERNVALIHEGATLHLELLLTGQEGKRLHRWPLFEADPGEPVHVVVTYEPGRLRAYRNGEPAGSRDVPEADFRDWRMQPLTFGGDAQEPDSWAGSIEGVAWYNRVLTPDEIAARHALYAGRLAQRRIPEQAVMDARLIRATPIPDPAAIEPYRRALVVNEYEVLHVAQGVVEHDRILVAHWGIMDDRVLDDAEREPGQTYRMTVEYFDDRPELEGEWVAMETGDLLLPLYYDTDS